VAQIRERLDDHPMTIRIEIRKGEPPRPALPARESANGSDAITPQPGLGGALTNGEAHRLVDRQRELAAALVALPEVVGVELLPDEGPDDPVSRVLVRARNPQRFFQALARLVLDEWYEVRHLQTLDESTQAVLGYLLGGRG
jgi:hypothetical protein